ncbi:MAG: hypothetical protein VW057_03775 [Rhodospirillaceae bacterium]
MPKAAMLALTAGARSISVAAVGQFVRVLTALQWIPKIWQFSLHQPINRQRTQPAHCPYCKQIKQLHRIIAYVLGVPTTGVRSGNDLPRFSWAAFSTQSRLIYRVILFIYTVLLFGIEQAQELRLLNSDSQASKKCFA